MESCTISFMPRNREQISPPRSDQVGPTGSVKITWRTDEIAIGSSGGYRLYSEATYTSLNDQHLPLARKEGIKPLSSGVLQFVIDDLNPGNYVIEFMNLRRGATGGAGRTSSIQVTAGKQREYDFGNEVGYFPARPGRVRAEAALKGVMGIYDCATPAESIYVNQRYSDQVQKFDPFADRIFIFESSFSDTVAVLVDEKLVAKKYMKGNSSGLSDQLKIKASSGAKISIRTTPNDCVEFRLKEGYKYLFINRYPVRKWDIAYSNFSRGYY